MPQARPTSSGRKLSAIYRISVNGLLERCRVISARVIYLPHVWSLRCTRPARQRRCVTRSVIMGPHETSGGLMARFEKRSAYLLTDQLARAFVHLKIRKIWFGFGQKGLDPMLELGIRPQFLEGLAFQLEAHA